MRAGADDHERAATGAAGGGGAPAATRPVTVGAKAGAVDHDVAPARIEPARAANPSMSLRFCSGWRGLTRT